MSLISSPLSRCSILTIQFFFEYWEKDAKLEYKITNGYKESLALDIFRECFGFAACVNFSRVCGDMDTADFDCIKDNALRTKAKFTSVTIDKDGEKVQVPVTLGMQSDYYVEISGDDIEEGTAVYYSTPMVNNPSSGDSSADSSQDGISFDMGGGDMGGGPGGGGAPAGGGPGGF